MQIILAMSLLLVNADFPICTEANIQNYPTPIYTNNQYCVFWTDYRDNSTTSTSCLYVARISNDGTVLDPGGKLVFRDSVTEKPVVAYDGTNFLVALRNGC